MTAMVTARLAALALCSADDVVTWVAMLAAWVAM
jgi:hypothetical protein